MGTLKFKVGDKVRVKSLEWYNENKNLDGDIINKAGKKNGVFYKYMRSWCGEVIKINSAKNNYYGANNSWHWYDWMLEDEAVTEEKQEVEQLNKNDMETKEMTKEEVFVYLGNTKILCASTEETVKVQEKLFELGIVWMYDGQNVREDKYLLFINQKGNISYCSEIEFWMKDVNRRIEPSEILAIQIKEEKPKFDPKTLKAFDKVLVKNDTIWYARFYDMIVYNMKGENEYHTTSGEVWIDCIPYNEDTMHLHGTTQDAPEFYRI